MKDCSMYIGMDVHKESIDVALAPAGREEVRSYGQIGGDLDSVDKLLKRLRASHGEVRVVYEAGPCGYALYRHLKQKGIDCAVVAPSMIPKRSGDRIKTDRRDAINLARGHRAGDLKAVYVPDIEDEAIRDMARAREDAVLAHKRGRQQLAALLLRQNRRCVKAKAWTQGYKNWLATVAMPHPVQQPLDPFGRQGGARHQSLQRCMDIDSERPVARLDQPFGQRKAQHQIIDVSGCRHQHRIADAA